MKTKSVKNRLLVVLSFSLPLSSCSQMATPAAPHDYLAIEQDQRLPEQMTKNTLLKSAFDNLLKSGTIPRTDRVSTIQQGSATLFLIPTSQPGVQVAVVSEGDLILSISALHDGANRVVTDLNTAAVTVLQPLPGGQFRVVDSGYADFGRSLFRIASKTAPFVDALRTQAAALAQCTGSVPSNLLQARAQARNDYNSYQDQLGAAVATHAAFGAALLIACGATVVTVGVSSGACILAGAAYTRSILDVQEKTRQRNDASIRLQYSQQAIDDWKSNYASSQGCVWY